MHAPAGQPFKVPGLAKEIGLVGGEQVDAHLALCGSLLALDKVEIRAIAVQLVVLQALAQAGADQRFFSSVHADMLMSALWYTKL